MTRLNWLGSHASIIVLVDKTLNLIHRDAKLYHSPSLPSLHRSTYRHRKGYYIHTCSYNVTIATLANITLKISWLLHLAHINKGPNTLTLHMPRTSNISIYYQCLHLSPRLKHQPSSLISFAPTN
jgi:hypothetical protein